MKTLRLICLVVTGQIYIFILRLSVERRWTGPLVGERDITVWFFGQSELPQSDDRDPCEVLRFIIGDIINRVLPVLN